MLIVVDPGKDAGVAVFEDRELVWAFLSRGKWQESAWNAASKIAKRFPFEIVVASSFVFEQPVPRGNGLDRNIMELPLMAAAMMGYLHIKEVTYYHPEDWKGQLPKTVMRNRLLSKISTEEYSRIEMPAKTLEHNVYDAIGIGFHHLGRKRR